MKRRHVLTGLSVTATAATFGGLTFANPLQNAAYAAEPDEAAAQALQRLLPDHHDQITVSISDERDTFTVNGEDGAIEVAGGTAATVLAGVNWYLKHVATVDVSWPGSSLAKLPDTLPAPDSALEQTATVARRFALNDTHEGYTGPYRTWSDWERELDLLAAHGYNEALVTVGAETIYRLTFADFDYSDEELRDWLPLPPHQPWFLMQNMHDFGSTNSTQLMEARVELGQKIFTRCTELGITPVLTGYFGHVPPEFADRHSGVNVVEQGEWYGFDRPDWLDPREEIFGEIAAKFYEHQAELFGEAKSYKMDLLHEGGDPGDVPPADAAASVMEALQTARPDASWVFIGWRDNPLRDMLDALDDAHVYIVDGLSDRDPDLDREEEWAKPYAFGTIPNFGGRTTLGGNSTAWSDRFPAWRDASGSNVVGTAWMPEGAGRDPATFELFGEVAWRAGSVDLEKWFTDYANRRYGGADEHAAAAWDALRTTAYAMPEDDNWSEPQDGVFTAQPALSAQKSGSWSPEKPRYDTVAFDKALEELLQVDSDLHTDSYRYDLVDVARQSLTNAGRKLLPRVKAAYDAGDADTFAALQETWLSWMDLLDRLLGSDERFLIGPWLEASKEAAGDGDEAVALEYNARTMVTAWGHRDGAEAGLRDYANRELSGLMADYYAARWKAFLDARAAEIDSGEPSAPLDWFALADDWSRETNEYPTEASGDPVELATEVRDALAAATELLTVSVTSDSRVVEAGESITVEASVRNLNSFTEAVNLEATLSGPEGWTFEADGATETDALPPGEEVSVTWQATAPDDAAAPVDVLVVEVTHRYGDTDTVSSAPLRVLRPGEVGDDWSTVTFNDATFGMVDDAVAIHGGGADLFGGTNEFGAIYAPGGLADGSAMSVAVTAQEFTGAWARAGLIVRNDLGTDGEGGFLTLSVTPHHGCVLASDTDGNGKLNKEVKAPGSAPLYLRVRREGTDFHAEYSADGSQWEEVGTAELADAAEASDVGVFMSASYNSGDGETTGIAEFRDLDLS